MRFWSRMCLIAAIMAIGLAILPVASAENISTNIAPMGNWEVGSATVQTLSVAQALFPEAVVAHASGEAVAMTAFLNVNGESEVAAIVQRAFEGVDSKVVAEIIEVARLAGAPSFVAPMVAFAETNNGDPTGAYNGIIGTPIREIPAVANVIRHEAAFAGGLGVVA